MRCLIQFFLLISIITSDHFAFFYAGHIVNNNNYPQLGTLLSKKRVILWLTIGILLIWLSGQLIEMCHAGEISLYDFIEYWTASRVFLTGGNAYSYEQLLEAQRLVGWKENTPLMMWNPPWIFPILIPISIFDYWPSRGIWLLINIIIVWKTADWFWRVYGGSFTRRWISWLIPLFFLPVATAIFLGQTIPMVLAGLAGFLQSVAKKKHFLAGIFAFLVSVKPHILFLFWVFLAFWILKHRYWGVLMGALSAFLCAVAIAGLVNPHVFSDYLKAVCSNSGPLIWQTPTWGTALSMLFPNDAKWVRYLPSFLGIAISAYLWNSWKHNFDWLQKLPIIIFLSIITCIFSWSYDWVVLLPVIVLLLCQFERFKTKSWWIFLLILIAMQPLLVYSQIATKSNLSTIWFPPAFWLLFWYSSIIDDRRPWSKSLHC